MARTLKSARFAVGVTLVPSPEGGWLGYQHRSKLNFKLEDKLDDFLRGAYIENVGHEPPAPRNEIMSEQFGWPNAKRRKYRRMSIEEVAQVTTA